MFSRGTIEFVPDLPTYYCNSCQWYQSKWCLWVLWFSHRLCVFLCESLSRRPRVTVTFLEPVHVENTLQMLCMYAHIEAGQVASHKYVSVDRHGTVVTSCHSCVIVRRGFDNNYCAEGCLYVQRGSECVPCNKALDVTNQALTVVHCCYPAPVSIYRHSIVLQQHLMRRIPQSFIKRP